MCRTPSITHTGSPALSDAVTDKRYVSGNGPHATSIGTTLLDYDFLRLAPPRRPAVTFHQVGQMLGPVSAPNLVVHGEVPDADAVGFAAQSDICLALYEDRPESAYLAVTSNKIALYMALRERIIAPEFLRSSLERRGIFFYDIKHPPSIDEALDAALSFDPADVPPSEHCSWDGCSGQAAEVPWIVAGVTPIGT